LTNLLFLSASSQIGSVNWRLASAAAELAQRAFGNNVSATVLDLTELELPTYDGSRLDSATMPLGVATLRTMIARSDGIFISSDEYTGAYSALFKNAVAWLTQTLTDGDSLFAGVPCALCGASLRGIGSLRGHPALHQMLAELGAKVISQHIELGTSSSPFDAAQILLPKVERQLLEGCLGSLFVEATKKKNS
jgi:NAD(P)H-dependent FMN reductase